jgi:hypothetical protein
MPSPMPLVEPVTTAVLPFNVPCAPRPVTGRSPGRPRWSGRRGRRSSPPASAALRAGAAGGLQVFEEVALGVELAGDAERLHPLLVADHVDAHVPVARREGLLQRTLLQQALHEGDGAHLVQERGVEGDLVHPVVDLERGARDALALQRVDPHQHDVRGRAAVDQGPDRRVAHAAAVPVRVAVDLHRLVEVRQAGRGERRVERELVLAEDPRSPGAHVGGGDEDAERPAGAHRVDVDPLGEEAAQRVVVERVGLVGREQPAEQGEPEVARRVVEVPAPEQPVEPGPLERAEDRALAGADPEPVERPPGPLPAAPRVAGGGRGGVQRPGAGAADRPDDDAVVLEQAVEHAPAEGAVRAPALERETHAARPRLGGAERRWVYLRDRTSTPLRPCVLPSCRAISLLIGVGFGVVALVHQAVDGRH